MSPSQSAHSGEPNTVHYPFALLQSSSTTVEISPTLNTLYPKSAPRTFEPIRFGSASRISKAKRVCSSILYLASRIVPLTTLHSESVSSLYFDNDLHITP
jgi:hypothetical protein